MPVGAEVVVTLHPDLVWLVAAMLVGKVALVGWLLAN